MSVAHPGPVVTPPRFISPSVHSAFYWTSGADGLLRILGCSACQRLHHPPGPVCPFCHSRDLAPVAVSGHGTVAAFTINRQPFMPGFDPPYAFGFVELDEDPAIRISTNLVDCALDHLHIGMRVRVRFEANGDYFVPLFGPLDPSLSTAGD
jgi:uncharacterized OB-fold protein